jgi:N-acetylmuramic acid 6-phosphate etherase
MTGDLNSVANTESVNPDYADIDRWPTVAAIEAMLDGQQDAIAALRGQETAIAAACEAAAASLATGGRIIYAGAGTSIRIAVQDGVELGPTFGWPPERLAYVIAGGPVALMSSAEGAEDDGENARVQVTALSLTANDILIGVAASGRTPFTIAAVEAARLAGALTIGIANNPDTPLPKATDHAIVAATGSELIAGSTRMKAGTAQKAALNLLSTGIMLRLGRVYRGLMVDMIISNDKLLQRGRDMVVEISGCDARTAAEALAVANNDIKLASLIAMGHLYGRATQVLAQSNHVFREALALLQRDTAHEV